ncbi:MAG: DUF523 domain-containing protein [Eggerthellaceae bacterium]|jgi:uncharacterized protein YbbK (DUF523 family)
MPHKVLISACLLGERCRFDGGAKPNDAARRLYAVHADMLVPVCPEALGGLKAPRSASEIDASSERLRVVSAEGEDRTEAFVSGAKACRYIAEETGCRVAVLKAKSPSCGSGRIYDGTFSHTLTEGWGVAAGVLDAAGIVVIDENRLAELEAAGRIEDLFSATVPEDLA